MTARGIAVQRACDPRLEGNALDAETEMFRHCFLRRRSSRSTPEMHPESWHHYTLHLPLSLPSSCNPNGNTRGLRQPKFTRIGQNWCPLKQQVLAQQDLEDMS